mmetsp:Transcript_5255/g.16887  ORF Transcript_5255/g.16887 Transcript_5255/m.16887 type:complete len:207 (+) Transcript_5255:947-1567(+)
MDAMDDESAAHEVPLRMRTSAFDGTLIGCRCTVRSSCPISTRNSAVKVDPWPKPRDRHDTVPPISSVSSRQMYRPRPVPPYCLVVDSSTCANSAKRRSIASSGMPIPVSVTMKAHRSCHLSSNTSRRSSVTTTDPSCVNLSAFVTRLKRTCRMRVASPRTFVDTSGCMSRTKSMFLVNALWVVAARTDSTILSRSVFWYSRMSEPA